MSQVREPSSADTASSRQAGIAPVWHTCILIAVLGLLAFAGAASNVHAVSKHAISLEVLEVDAIVFEWLMFLFIWWGIHLRGYPLKNLIRQRQATSGRIWRDVLIGLAFGAVWYGVDLVFNLALVAAGVKNGANHAVGLPHGAIQITLAFLAAASAGFCEEVMFRGYLQRQFSNWTGKVSWGIVLQAIVFAVAHRYQGVINVVFIAMIAVSLGVLAQWLRNLRPLMVAHAGIDIVGLIIRGLPFGK